MRVVTWLAAFFAGSLLFGLLLMFYFAEPTSRTVDGLSIIAILIVAIAACSSGMLLLMLGPTAFDEHFRPPN
jgi:hypothetical protein